jgi:hypothetical protein
LLEEAPELASGEHSALRHWTAILLPMFSSLSEDCGKYSMSSGRGEPIQISDSEKSEAKMFKHALGGYPKMKFMPGRVTNTFFLRFRL